MLGHCTHNHPIQDGIAPQEGSKAEVVLPPKICTKPCISLANIPANPIPLAQEDFGREKDLKNLLKSLQPKNFSSEGDNVSNILEEWTIEMEDYFALANYNPVAQGIMGKAKLIGSAKRWWKLKCQSCGVAEVTHHWNELQARLKEQYYPLNFETLKMNEFLACNQKGRIMDLYYEEFVKLSCYAPLMTKEQKLNRFIQQLGDELANEVDAL